MWYLVSYFVLIEIYVTKFQILQSSAASSGGVAQNKPSSLQHHPHNNTTEWQSVAERTRRRWTPTGKHGHIQLTPN